MTEKKSAPETLEEALAAIADLQERMERLESWAKKKDASAKKAAHRARYGS